MEIRIKNLLTAFSILSMLLTSCTNVNSNESDNSLTCMDSKDTAIYKFIFITDSDTLYFNAATSDEDLIRKASEELSKPLDERIKHINGLLSSGECSYNLHYDWHFIHNEWDLVEASIEWCDAFPANPDSTGVDRVCPWSSRIYES
mgnify:FL=1